jgi:Group II intron, maturase-specific domain
VRASETERKSESDLVVEAPRLQKRPETLRTWVVYSDDAAGIYGGSLRARLVYPSVVTGGNLRVPAGGAVGVEPASDRVDDGFDLLGFRIVRRPWRGSKRVAITFPCQRALREVMHRIKTLTTRRTTSLSLDQLMQVLNPTVRGWTSYHRHAGSSRCFAYLRHYVWWRVIRWLRKKHERLTWKQIRRQCWGTTGPAAKARGSPGPTR